MYVEVKFDFCNQLTKTFLVECLFINSLFLLIGEFAIFSISISIFCSQDLKTTVNLSDEMRQVTQQNAKQVCMCNAVSCVAYIHNIYNNIYNTTIFTTQQYLRHNNIYSTIYAPSKCIHAVYRIVEC